MIMFFVFEKYPFSVMIKVLTSGTHRHAITGLGTGCASRPGKALAGTQSLLAQRASLAYRSPNINT